jgi:co-chaperonin GroES (HSP10)
MKAINDLLIVEETIKEQTTKSGIILPTYGEGYKDGQMTVSTDIVATQAPEAKTGRVLSVGPEARLINVGDMVIWSAYSGKELTDGTSTYVALSINDVIAVSRT